MNQSGNGNILKLPLRIYIIPYQLRHGFAISSTPFKGKVFSLKKKNSRASRCFNHRGWGVWVGMWAQKMCGHLELNDELERKELCVGID